MKKRKPKNNCSICYSARPNKYVSYRSMARQHTHSNVSQLFLRLFCSCFCFLTISVRFVLLRLWVTNRMSQNLSSFYLFFLFILMDSRYDTSTNMHVYTTNTTFMPFQAVFCFYFVESIVWHKSIMPGIENANSCICQCPWVLKYPFSFSLFFCVSVSLSRSVSGYFNFPDGSKSSHLNVQ